MAKPVPVGNVVSNQSYFYNQTYQKHLRIGRADRGDNLCKNCTSSKEGNRTVTRNIAYYNLDIIISVGYRIKSHVATKFRIWATQRLKEYIIKGFTLDDERMKAAGQIRYFDELQERIRDIRSSEKIFYQKVKDIFALSIDYDPQITLAREFFATIQNKLHWAIHQHTAAELIAKRAKASEKKHGVNHLAGSQNPKTDVSIAKNYLKEEEIN
jgi:hypothetical protein